MWFLSFSYYHDIPLFTEHFIIVIGHHTSTSNLTEVNDVLYPSKRFLFGVEQILFYVIQEHMEVFLFHVSTCLNKISLTYLLSTSKSPHCMMNKHNRVSLHVD